MSYGSSSQIAVLRPRYANSSGAFDASTRPTSQTITAWDTQISALMDAALATEGFSVPVTDDDALNVLALFVNQLCADLADAVNGSGRFRSGSKETSKAGLWSLIGSETADFVKRVAIGLESMGATRDFFGSTIPSLTNADGDDIKPHFDETKDWFMESDY